MNKAVGLAIEDSLGPTNLGSDPSETVRRAAWEHFAGLALLVRFRPSICTPAAETEENELPLELMVEHWYEDFRWANEVEEDEDLPAFAVCTDKKSYWFVDGPKMVPFY